MKSINGETIYFSPTNTTKTIIEAISTGFNNHTVDLTFPDYEKDLSLIETSDLAIIGSPVYSGRLPVLFTDRLRKIKGNGLPAVIVVVYGNRAYEDALLELRDMAIEAGFRPIAAAGFIAEHSFSTNEKPIAKGRPDSDDLKKAREFGEQIKDKISSRGFAIGNSPLRVPGEIPYKPLKANSEIKPFVHKELCTNCMQCISLCPAGAIDKKDPTLTDGSLCIMCCACIKGCDQNAREMTDPGMLAITEKLHTLFKTPLQPEFFI